ncbi:molybdopterin molybdotransferase MoeA [Radiobacillus kanasensis]|uniref:molybdopterin molybdotransferase MoeA n=1 Tax=Radiobacillus kanasensis TaxID=2844358 RepID=UPI001E4E3E61|nr:gephyrin-like molybdotransferase Glp [Radiobacillus kanasensis]UFT98311.1 molybdopterin molybdotransferase MoeA [Radiobacillus kanasensis]
MLDRRKPIPVTDALDRVLQVAAPGEIEQVSLDMSLNRTLGDDIVATHDVPLFDRSPYDGFAIIAKDTEGASREIPTKLQVVGHIGAGSLYSKTLQHGQAVRIMTGAQLPAGSDAIVMLELVKESEENGDSFIHLNREFKSGTNISYQGEDTKKGTPLLKKGEQITPGTMAILATFGYQKVPVTRQPKVGILATGSELVEVHEPLQAGKIRNSNAYMLMGQVKSSGAIPLYLGQLEDDLEQCFKKVKESLEQVDILITTGGVSVGDYDHMPEIYNKLGARVLFNKVAMRPGSVTTVAEYEDKLLFGLSGNPSACFVGFELFTKPAIHTFLQKNEITSDQTPAILGNDFPKPNPFNRYIRAECFLENGQWIATPLGLDKSSAVISLARTNCLIELPGGTRGFQKGDSIQIIRLQNS